MSNEEQPPHSKIELEPLRGSPHGTGGADHDTGTPDDEVPVPEIPAHACPNCDYNLAGLKSRRCPECGEEFLLYEARWHAVEIGQEGEELRRVRRRDKTLYIIGGASGLVGMLIPVVAEIVRNLPSGTPTPWMPSPPCHLIPSITLLLLFKLYYEWRWSSVACIAGIYVLIGGLATLV